MTAQDQSIAVCPLKLLLFHSLTRVVASRGCAAMPELATLKARHSKNVFLFLPRAFSLLLNLVRLFLHRLGDLFHHDLFDLLLQLCCLRWLRSQRIYPIRR